MSKRNFFYNKNFYILLLIFFGSFLILRNFNNGFWSDEWSTIYFSNPSKFNLILTGDFDDGSSKYFYIILIWWNKLFGYYSESIRLFSNFFGICSILIFLRLSREFKLNNEHIILSLSLFVTNFFLIHYSEEARWYSFSLFLSLLSIYGYIKSLKKDKYLIFFILASTISSLINIFSSIILLSAFVHALIYRNKKLLICSLISLLLILLLKLDYILLRLFDERQLGTFTIGSPFTKSFFIGYFFNNYFGNIFFGGLALSFVLFIVIYFKSTIFNNHKINFIILIIILSYLLPLIYSYLFKPILRDRYILFVVPLIILFLSYFITNFPNMFYRKIVIYFFIICSFININFHKIYFSKPSINDALTIVLNSNSKNVFLKNSKSQTLFNNYIFFSKFAKKNNIKFHKDSKKLDELWTICLNSPRFATSLQVDNKECFENEFINTHSLENTIKIPDLVLRNYKKIE